MASRENEYATLRVVRDGPVATVVLARPGVRNAFDETMISELTAAFVALGDAPGLRAVVLTGEGKIFCAGADVSWMRRAAGYSAEENREDAAGWRDAAYDRHVPAAGHRQHRRAAIGGGVAPLPSATSRSPPAERCSPGKSSWDPSRGDLAYVLQAIGPRNARDLFLTGESPDAEEARRIGWCMRSSRMRSSTPRSAGRSTLS
jgi:methylglutaconyl-CoA hydratase